VSSRTLAAGLSIKVKFRMQVVTFLDFSLDGMYWAERVLRVPQMGGGS